MFDYTETANRIEFALQSYLKETSLGFVRRYADNFQSLIAVLWELETASVSGGDFDTMRYQEITARLQNAHNTGLTIAEERALADIVRGLYDCSVAAVALDAPVFDGINVILYINQILLALDAAAEMQINDIIADIPADVFA